MRSRNLRACLNPRTTYVPTAITSSTYLSSSLKCALPAWSSFCSVIAATRKSSRAGSGEKIKECAPRKQRLQRADARAERNTYVHGVWASGVELGTAVVQTFRWNRSEIIKHEITTAADIHELARHIDDLITELHMIGGKLGFPTG